MSLRRSPTRSPALLAANRLNARRSTGPRTLEGKRQSALNALKHGQRAQTLGTLLAGRAADEFNQLRQALWEAIVPKDGQDQELVNRFACHVWTVRREIERRVATPAGRALRFSPRGGFPRPWRQRVQRRRWKVSVSVWLRRGRSREGRWVPQPAHGWREGQGRLHTIVTVTASMGHPEYRVYRGPSGWIAPRLVFRTKPESRRKGEGFEYNIPIPKSGVPGGLGIRRARSRLLPGGQSSPAGSAPPPAIRTSRPGPGAQGSTGPPPHRFRAFLGRLLPFRSLLRGE